MRQRALGPVGHGLVSTSSMVAVGVRFRRAMVAIGVLLLAQVLSGGAVRPVVELMVSVGVSLRCTVVVVGVALLGTVAVVTVVVKAAVVARVAVVRVATIVRVAAELDGDAAARVAIAVALSGGEGRNGQGGADNERRNEAFEGCVVFHVLSLRISNWC